MTTQESDFRLGELILFISQKSANDGYFGAVKLNKLLFYCDAFAFARWGKSITGTQYWNQREGPVPKRLVQVRAQLFAENPPALAIQLIETGLRPQQKLIALRPARLEKFSGDRLLLVEDVIQQYKNLSGTNLSDKSHLEWGWKLTSKEDDIDLRTILLSPLPDQPNKHEQKRALEILEADTDIQQQLQALIA